MVSIQKWCLFEAMVQRLGIVVHEIMASYTQHTARPLSLRWFGRFHIEIAVSQPNTHLYIVITRYISCILVYIYIHIYMWFLHVLFDHVWSKPKLLHPETAIFLKIKLYFRELHV